MEGLDCDVHVDWIRLKHVSKSKYLGCVTDKSSTDGAECRRKMASGKRVAGAIRSLVNARGLELECSRVLNVTLLVPVLSYGSKTLLWKGKERSRIRAIQMDTLRGLLSIRKMDRVLNAQIRELCGFMKVFSGGSAAMWRGW